ncbi:MAG: hypothetical protein ACRDQ4_18905, partial [Pseudonocardiaceae bacterium]
VSFENRLAGRALVVASAASPQPESVSGGAGNRLHPAIRAARPGGNLQQRPCLGVGGQRCDLLLCLIIVDNAVHLHPEPGKPFLERCYRLILGYVFAGQ